MLRNNVIVRLVLWYLAVLVFLATIMTAFPIVVEWQLAERARTPLGFSAASQTPEFSQQVAEPRLLNPQALVPVALGMVGALLLALPLSWTYSWTRRPKKVRRAIAQTLIALPVAVALVLFLVKGSLALAFSLAGVVAAIRWRTSLDNTMDAVFAFVAIGIGLATGVQYLFVAFIASAFFNFLIVFMARYQVGRDPMQLDGWTLKPVSEYQVDSTQEITLQQRDSQP
ncbi:MAG: DUF4956 domain-containing protein [Gemmatimonadota bacterium]|nr:MAG: DUF4956 domain-containing protein [Gemmatimonadota bacterium]